VQHSYLASRPAVSAEKLIAAQSPRDGEVHVLPVQGNVYMLVADGTNITASVGPDGVTLVNTGAAQMSEKVVAAVPQLARTVVAPTATMMNRPPPLLVKVIVAVRGTSRRSAISPK